MRRTFALFVLVMCLALLGCELAESTYEPSVHDVRVRLGGFVVPQATGLRPLYANGDVDSVVATYCVPPPLQPVIDTMIRDARQDGWQYMDEGGGHLVFDRAGRSRYERVDVRIPARSPCLALSFLQTDAKDASAFGRSSEGDWARSELWRVLEHAAEQLDSRR
jgi:hypothetical protein